MYQIHWASRFRRDVKLCEKRRKDMSKFKHIHEFLAHGKSLPPQNRDHNLGGVWRGCRECHIEPDWLLIYRISEKEGILEYVRMGTHSDLFR
ncbi:MAG TPA: type II toxin-antitoxin system YafQ family toxin [Alphaproteobacteria bacterium]|nr:type II toxin-antitoxin system YafQ family toxin [Alphaproteobacteria bacterium]